MGYRDNLNAILARSQALERDLEQARRTIDDLRGKLDGRRIALEDLSALDQALDDSPVTDDDRVLADEILSRALAYDPAAHVWEAPPAAPPPSPPPNSAADLRFGEGRELGREEGAVAALRFALHQLLTKRLDHPVSGALSERVNTTTDTDQLTEWIVAVGIARDDEIERFIEMAATSKSKRRRR